MGARVLFRDSQGRDGQVVLDPNTPMYVGRALDCAIRTDDAMVSRKHSMIRMEGGRFTVEDLGSSNGTHVNDQRVSKQALVHNDVVRCGSLWLRYVEDSPLSAAAPQPVAAAPAGPKKGGTVRLDVAGGPAAAQPVMAQPVAPRPVAPQPPQPQYQPQAYGPSGYGGPPSMPPPAPGGGPPSMPPPAPAGGPPAMPGAPGVVGGREVAVPAAAPAMAEPRGESSVVVDMGDTEDVARLKRELEVARVDLEQLQGQYDREVADGKRLRAEVATLRERIEELRGSIKDRDDQVAAHNRVAEELRQELAQTKDELGASRQESAELSENVLARERQLGRAQEDIGKLKEEIDDLKRQLVEVSKTKDEGWRKLNEQLGEIEHLREVINEQERMLEERRVGLISQEEAIKGLRAERERALKEMASVKAERDELAANEGRRDAQIFAIDEENRRLSRLIVELQSGTGGGSADQGDHVLKQAAEIKDLRVEIRKLESDKERIEGKYGRADKQVEKLETRVAELEVELREAAEKRATAESTKAVAEEAMAKAEVARHKAAEEALEAAKARDVAMSSADDARRELDRLKRRFEQLESQASEAAAGDDGARLAAENEALQRKVKEATDRANELERSVGTLKAETEAARADAKHARAEAEAAALLADGGAGAVPAAPDGVGDGDATATHALKARAGEVYEGINDVLSELRNNVLLIQAEFDTVRGASGEPSEDSIRIISDTMEALVGNAEDAKGVLRGLRELSDADN